MPRETRTCAPDSGRRSKRQAVRVAPLTTAADARTGQLQRRIANFVAALLEAGLVDAGVILERLLSVEERRRPDADCAVAWLESWRGVV